MADDFRAFTKTHTSMVRVLTSWASIGTAFNPSHSSPPKFTKFDAIWDTGATGSVISNNVVSKCGLQPIGMVKVYTANGDCICNEYLVSIRLPNKVQFTNVRVTEGKLEGADMLIGMDIIGSGDFAVTNHRGKTVFSYRVPSVARIDFVDQAKKSNVPRVGRNDPCPCGSGKKYKKCHGLDR